MPTVDPDIRTFLDNIENAGRREDAEVLLKLMADASGEKPEVYGSAIGYGHYHYVYESGREGDSVLVSFAPRKANMVVYIMPGFSKYGALLNKLGKFKTGSSCLYLGRLKNVDLKVLHKLVERSVKDMRKKYHG
jgi:hypothetical protein|tara:strand:+ start:1581 stop:1982 length:402 start_codon:yes stop_codon:yes gene_type:complete